MAVRGKGESTRWPLEKEEGLRERVADQLHGNVRTGLSVCNVWLAMAEELLAGAHAEAVDAMFRIEPGDGEGRPPDAEAAIRYQRPFVAHQLAPRSRTSSCAMFQSTDGEMLDDRVTQRIVAALSLLYKVRGEVERLRKTEVPHLVETLYPTLINVGLRPALESLLDGMRREHGADDGYMSPEVEGDAADLPSARSATGGGLPTRAILTVPTVRWLVDEPFVKWDQPSRDEQLLRVRLEAYRFLETVLRAAQVAYNYLARSESGVYRDMLDGRPPHVDVWFRLGDGSLHMVIHADSGCGDDVEEKLFEFILRALPRERLEQAGGTLSVTSTKGSGLQIAASLPVGNVPCAG